MARLLTKKERNEAMDMLFIARMQHTRWVAEVNKQQVPEVEPDPTQCDFGRWLLSAREKLEAFEAFRALEAPHTELHDAYKRLLNHPDDPAEPEHISACSRVLMENIDQLEKALKHAKLAPVTSTTESSEVSRPSAGRKEN